MENNEKLYTKGFNRGYILAKFEPQILDSLLNGIRPITPFINGMKFGQIEYQQELLRDRINEIDNLKKNNLELDRDWE